MELELTMYIVPSVLMYLILGFILITVSVGLCKVLLQYLKRPTINKLDVTPIIYSECRDRKKDAIIKPNRDNAHIKPNKDTIDEE